MFRNVFIVNALILLLAVSAAAQDGAVVHLVHPDAVTGVDTSSNQDRGAFVRMLRGFDVTAVTVRLDLATAGNITANIYEANDYLRGALVATATIAATDLGNVEHTIPITATLDPCADYDIAVEFGDVDGWDYFYELDGPVPYERHGVVLVGSASVSGSAAALRIPHISLVGESSRGTLSDLTQVGYDWLDWTCSDPTTDRSVYVRALQTVAVTTVGFDYDPPASVVTLRARIYEVVGNARGPLVAEGSIETTANERRVWQIPVNAVLREGHQYDIAAVYPVGDWGCRPEADFDLPFVAGGVIEVRDGALNGNPANSYLPHFTVNWESQVGGVAVDLDKPSGPPPFSSTDASKTRSLYVFPISNHEAASIGWYADVPEGEVITARIYNSSGTVRGPIVSEGSIVSTGGGERWHDIPVAAAFHKLQGYELNVSFASVNLWRYWGVGPDYYATPEIQVTAAGADGTGAAELPHMRFNACYSFVTGVGDGPARPAGLVLRAPYPNPVSGESLIGYRLDRAGTVSIDVFDVRGHRVATLLEPTDSPPGDGAVSLSAAALPAGVYFVKLAMPHASVSRKVLIVR